MAITKSQDLTPCGMAKELALVTGSGMVRAEICIDSLASADIVAEVVEHAPVRIELCSNLIQGGGLTPTVGLLRKVLHKIPSAEVMVMIRPRQGSFVYSATEMETMLEDISVFRSEPRVKGFVFGCLTPSGEVDEQAVRKLVDAAKPKDVTFHRAFDVTPDWTRAFDTIASIPGITRILTSGQAPTALEGAEVIAALHKRAEGTDISIIAGSGLDARAIFMLRQKIPLLSEVHLTASSAVRPVCTPAIARGAELGFGTGEEWRMDVARLKGVWRIVAPLKEYDPRICSNPQSRFKKMALGI